jgi:hypothetical protein
MLLTGMMAQRSMAKWEWLSGNGSVGVAAMQSGVLTLFTAEVDHNEAALYRHTAALRSRLSVTRDVLGPAPFAQRSVLVTKTESFGRLGAAGVRQASVVQQASPILSFVTSFTSYTLFNNVFISSSTVLMIRATAW